MGPLASRNASLSGFKMLLARKGGAMMSMIDQRAAQAGCGKGRPNRLTRNLMSKVAALPMIFTALVVFVGATIWTIVYSFTNSRLLPKENFVGFDQYERLWSSSRWLISIQNLMWYGVPSLILTLVIGFTRAALLDRGY